MNLIEAASKSFTLRVECFKLEIRIIWEGNRILKMYKNIDKLISVNDQKLDCYNNLQFEMGNINNEINKDLDYIMQANSKFKSQIQLHNDVKEIVEEKFRQMCLLNNEIDEIEELLVNELSVV